MSNNLSLLSSQNRVEVPVISVTIGEYTFGVYQKSKLVSNYQYAGRKIQYPNYVQSLQIKKINGKVNTYNLVFSYPITENDDPNFFDKVFSSVSDTRKMILSYGDVSVPSFMYRDEETVIVDVKQEINFQTPLIRYTVSAVSSAFKGSSGAYSFAPRTEKPSKVIYELLYGGFGLLDIFPGMKNRELVETYGLIPENDKPVKLELKTNVTAIEYLAYLVNCMSKYDTESDSINKGSLYTLNIIDSSSKENLLDSSKEFVFDGPYFKIVSNVKNNDPIDTYVIDVGFPSKNIVTQLSIEDNQGYVILYDYQGKINPNTYVQRINNRGQIEQEYAPAISSNNSEYKTRPEDKTWWTKVTQYPVKANITLKGLLRPSILMSYVRLNIYFFGKKYNLSGLYIITQQLDNIDSSGYRTTLSLTRVGGDNEE